MLIEDKVRMNNENNRTEENHVADIHSESEIKSSSMVKTRNGRKLFVSDDNSENNS